MKITRELIDNDKTIIHLNYSKKEIAEARKIAEEIAAKNGIEPASEDPSTDSAE